MHPPALGRLLAVLMLPAAGYAAYRAAGGSGAALLGGGPTVLFPLIAVLLLLALLLTVWQPGGTAATTAHGSAGWAAGKDVAGLAVPAGPAPAPGCLLLAPYGRRRQLLLPPELATHHTLILGPPGTGKTRALFLPNAAAATGSLVCTDPKGELWEHTSGYHPAAWRFAPREPEASMGFNWIPLCGDPRVAELLAAAVMQVDADGRGDPFWPRAEQQLCTGLFMHAAESPVPTPATAYALLAAGPEALMGELTASSATAARAAAATCCKLKAETVAAIVIGMANKLAFMRDPAVQRFTSAELTAPDFARLGRERTAVYWVVHEQDTALLQSLSALFFACVLDQLSRRRGPLPVVFLLDEFANIGRLPHFPTTITVARGRGLALVLGLQALSQLEGLYGKAGADTIRTACATKVILHGLDAHSAEEVSRLLGETTVRQELRSRKPEGWFASSYTYGEHETARRLLTADEVRRLGRDELLIVASNRRPIRAGKWCWTAPPHPAAASDLGEAWLRPPAPAADPAPGPPARRPRVRAERP